MDIGQAAPTARSRFWWAQLAGWPLAQSVYFRDPLVSSFVPGLRWPVIAASVTSCAMAIACSSLLALAYLRLRPRWLTGARAVPVALCASLLAAMPWACAMGLVAACVTDLGLRPGFGWRFLGYALALMSGWSGLFLWTMLSERVRKTEASLHRSTACTDGVALSGLEPSTDEAKGDDPDDRLCLRDATLLSYCRVRDILYIQAAGDYTEVHLDTGEVSMVKQRLWEWESSLPSTFERIHRSTLINLEQCEKLVYADGAWRVRLRGCSKLLTASRRRAQALKARMTR